MLGAISARVVLIGGIYRISSSFHVHISDLSLIDDWMRGVSSQTGNICPDIFHRFLAYFLG